MTGNSLRAAIVAPDPGNRGGVLALMRCIYRMLAERGITPQLLYTLCDPPLAGKKNLMGLRGRSIRRLDMDGFAMPAYPLPLWAWMLTPLLFGGKALRQNDLVVSVCGAAHFALLPAARGVPFVLWVATIYEDELRSKAENGDEWAQRILNSPTWPILQRQERFILRRASRILALSYVTAQRIIEEVPEVAAKVEVMLFPIDTGRYQPDPAAQTQSAYGEYLFMASRLNDPRKNVAMLLHAFALVRQHFPALKLVLAGDVPGEAVLSDVAALNLQDAVFFPGLVSADELLRLYQGAQLFTLSSKQEGLGIVMLEALACGTPVVATRCGGPEGVISEQVGRLVPNDDAEAFAESIIDLLSQPERLEAMRAACVTYAKKTFSWAAIEKQFFAALEAVFPERMTYAG